VTAERIPIFRRERTVAPRDIDLLGHVNNLVWVRYVVELAAAHADALGVGFEAMRARGGIWIVRRHEVVYHANVAAGARIREATWISELRGALSLRHARFESETGMVLVEARSEWAHVDAATLRPRRVPDEVRSRFDPVATEPGAAPRRPRTPAASGG
jgi:acyl-CoA thioester hydrolase